MQQARLWWASSVICMRMECENKSLNLTFSLSLMRAHLFRLSNPPTPIYSRMKNCLTCHEQSRIGMNSNLENAFGRWTEGKKKGQTDWLALPLTLSPRRCCLFLLCKRMVAPLPRCKIMVRSTQKPCSGSMQSNFVRSFLLLENPWFNNFTFTNLSKISQQQLDSIYHAR